MSRLPGRRLGRRAVVPKASKRAKPSSRLPLELILPAFSLLIALVAGPAIRNWLDISTVDPVDALDNAVFDHYRARGAVLHGKVGRACPECLRGIIATKNIRAGEAVFELPKRLAYSLTGEFKDRLQELPAVRWFLFLAILPSINEWIHEWIHYNGKSAGFFVPCASLSA
jgi:hypothetical protein